MDFPDLERAESAGLRLISCVALNCACSLAVVRPDSTAALLREMKSLSIAFSFSVLPEGITYQLARAGGGIHDENTQYCMCIRIGYPQQ